MRRASCIRIPETTLWAGLVRPASRIGIVTHTRPDGDALGSSLALKRYLDVVERKPCRILLDTPVPDSLRFLFTPEEEQELLVCALDRERVAEFAAGCDLLIFLDLNQLSRAGALGDLLPTEGVRRILVDHHPDPDPELFDLYFSECRISSTCELLYQLLLSVPACQDGRLPGPCLDPLLAGITTDTNNLSNSVFPSTLEAVSALLEAGADRDSLLEQLFQTYPERRLRLMGRLLDRELTITPDGVGYMILDEAILSEYGILEGETEGFVNLPLSIDRVRLSLLLRQNGDEYRVSIRSKRGWSARALSAAYFAGGGHEQAAGGKLPLGEGLRSKADAAAYIERCTHQFLSHETT